MNESTKKGFPATNPESSGTRQPVGCCGPEEHATCCAPAEKADCCGPDPTRSNCGCRDQT